MLKVSVRFQDLKPMHSSDKLYPFAENFVVWRRLHIAVLIMFMALSLLGGSTISTSASGSSKGGCAPGDSGCNASKVSLRKLDAQYVVGVTFRTHRIEVGRSHNHCVTLAP